MLDCKSLEPSIPGRCASTHMKSTSIENEVMTDAVFEAGDNRQRKTVREAKLRWQSQFILALVLLLSAAGLFSRLLSVWTPAEAEGLAICSAFGVLVWQLHAATPLAAVTGFLLTSCLYITTVDQPHGGWFHTALLPGLALFVLAFAATRFRRGQKEQTGLAESRRGRAASQVAANMGIAAIAALALQPSSLFGVLQNNGAHGRMPIDPILFVPLIAALAEAAADTVSSEIGQAIGGLPILITSGRRVPPGDDGGITLAGTAAGCVAAAVVVLSAIPTLRLNPNQAAVAGAAAIVGLFADSLIGATLERRGWLNNDAVNFISTAISAWLALAWSAIAA
jgi:uncharacterized protein (TIGR00297 family)